MSEPSSSAPHHSPEAASRPRVTVLLSLHPPDGTTKFVDQVVRCAPGELGFCYFSWRVALIGRYDVVHVHWPEFLLRSRFGLVRGVRTVLFVLVLLRWWVTSTPVVSTVHNLEPHDAGSRLERLLLAVLSRFVTVFVVLNELTPVPAGRRRVLIPHGHYADVLPRDDRPAQPWSLLYFGRIEAYKNVTGLVEAFGDLVEPRARLRIVGQPVADQAALLVTAAGSDDRVSLRLTFVSDAEMVNEMRTAQLVVLPYREMHNSGVLLVALSLGRPVLVPRTPSNELVAAEVGTSWVRLYDGSLTAGHLRQALAETASIASDARPTLAGRDWHVVGESYYQVYVLATAPDSRPSRRRRLGWPGGRGVTA